MLSPCWEGLCQGKQLVVGWWGCCWSQQQLGLVWSTGVWTGQSWYHMHRVTDHPWTQGGTAGWGWCPLGVHWQRWPACWGCFSQTSAASGPRVEYVPNWLGVLIHQTSCPTKVPQAGSAPAIVTWSVSVTSSIASLPYAEQHWLACSLPSSPWISAGGSRPGIQPQQTWWEWSWRTIITCNPTYLELRAMAGWAASWVRFRKAALLSCSSITRACSSSLNLLAKNLFLISRKFPLPTSIYK